jgi:hypothetical protein
MPSSGMVELYHDALIRLQSAMLNELGTVTAFVVLLHIGRDGQILEMQWVVGNYY